ncbi:MAG: ArsA family ATPase [Fervidicoccaceae archaeon]
MNKLISFWGKGGVGKTTLSIALTKLLSKEGFRTLYISTDIVPKNTQTFKNIENFETVFLSENEVRNLWKKRFGKEVYSVISSFLPVGEEIIDYIAGAPGISDEFSIYYIWEIWRNDTYDVIVWDTMAAGGSIRLLELESEFYSHLGEASKLYLKIKSSLESLKRKKDKDPLKLIEEWRELAKSLLSFLSSDAHDVYVVANPDSFSYGITTYLFQEFSFFGIRPKKLFLNKVISENVCQGCPALEEEKEKQRKWSTYLGEFSAQNGIEMCEIPYISGKADGDEIVEIVSESIKSCLSSSL